MSEGAHTAGFVICFVLVIYMAFKETEFIAFQGKYRISMPCDSKEEGGAEGGSELRNRRRDKRTDTTTERETERQRDNKKTERKTDRR